MSEVHFYANTYSETETQDSALFSINEVSHSYVYNPPANQETSQDDVQYSLKRVKFNNGENQTVMHAVNLTTSQTVTVDFHKFLASDISPIQERTDEYHTNFSTEEKPFRAQSRLGQSQQQTQISNIANCLSPTMMSQRHPQAEIKSLKNARDEYFLHRNFQTPSRNGTKSCTKKITTPTSPLLRTKTRIRVEKLNSTGDKGFHTARSFHDYPAKTGKTKEVQSATKDLTSYRRKEPTTLIKRKEGTRSLMKISSDKKLDIRPRLGSDHEASTSSIFQFKARPMPSYLPFEVKKSTKPCVIPEEPHLATEERGRQKDKCLKDELLRKKELENCTKSFKALPLPDYSKHNQSQVHSVFPVGGLHLHMNEKFEHHRGQSFDSHSHSVDSDSTKFRAHPMPNFSKVFHPTLGNTPLTEVHEFHLNTDIRAEKREEFDKHMLERLAEREAQRKREEEEKIRREREQIENWRKAITVKAHSMRPGSPIKMRMSIRSFTGPISPKGKRNFDALQQSQREFSGH